MPALVLFATLATPAGSLYRWEDDDGTVHYTDTIPPSQVSKGHTQFSETGVPVKTVPPVMTMEEVEKQQELERLRSEQQRLLEQLRVADRALLRTFRSEDDLIMARNGKLASIDVVIQVTASNIRRQQERLAALQATAGNLERSGKAIPKHLENEIASIEQAIQTATAQNAAHAERKEAIRASFDHDLKRFRKLTRVDHPAKRHSSRRLGSVLHEMVKCKTMGECDELWGRAVRYLLESARLPIENQNSNILVTEPPTHEAPISMILARISDPKDGGATVFLDLLCELSLSGEEMCDRSDAARFAEQFRAALTGEGTTSSSPGRGSADNRPLP